MKGLKGKKERRLRVPLLQPLAITFLLLGWYNAFIYKEHLQRIGDSCEDRGSVRSD